MDDAQGDEEGQGAGQQITTEDRREDEVGQQVEGLAGKRVEQVAREGADAKGRNSVARQDEPHGELVRSEHFRQVEGEYGHHQPEAEVEQKVGCQDKAVTRSDEPVFHERSVLAVSGEWLVMSGRRIFGRIQEAGVVFREHAQVLHLILQVGDALDAHTQGVAGVDLAVDAAGFEYVGVHHAATEDFYPAGTFAEGASLAAADVAADVHFGTGLCEGEVRRTQTYLRLAAEHLLGEEQQYLLQVGERHVLVDIQSLYLVDGWAVRHAPWYVPVRSWCASAG